MCVHIGGPPLVADNTFSHEMISNTLTLLLQGRLRHRGIGKNRLIISIDITRSNHRYAQHSQLVSETSRIFATLLHCDELRSKATRLNTSLLLRHPIDRCRIQINKETSPETANSLLDGLEIRFNRGAQSQETEDQPVPN